MVRNGGEGVRMGPTHQKVGPEENGHQQMKMWGAD